MRKGSTLTQRGSLSNTTISDNSTTEANGDELGSCAKPLSWDAPYFHSKDCLGAIDVLFFGTTLTGCYSQPCLFYGKNRWTRKNNAQITPRKYTFASCTIAIVMLDEFEPGELPGGDLEAAPQDMASYKEIEEDAKEIFATCVTKQGLLRWVQTGSRNSIGVFIWVTGSREDLDIERALYQEQTNVSPTISNISAVVR